MFKLKTISIIAACTLMLTLVGCGNKTDNNSSETVSTTTTESIPDATESTTEVTTSEAVTETKVTTITTESTSETTTETTKTSTPNTVISTGDISFTDLEPFFTEIAGKDIDTAETILRDTLSITSEREDIYEPVTDLTFYEFDLPDNVMICGIDFDYISLNTKDNTITGCSIVKEYEYYPEEDADAIKDKLDNIGYTEASDVQDEHRVADYNTDYGRVYVTLLTNAIVVDINELH